MHSRALQCTQLHHQRRRLALQVYLILDEFIMGGEIQETSKKVPALCPEC